MELSFQFLGGAGTVTGSKFLVTYKSKKILVDCGMFQGLKDLRLKNWAQFPLEASAIDAVILTHAHLDHTGYLPLLRREGFVGEIHCSEPTRALAELVLRDAANIQEEDAEQANRGGYSKHHPALPLFGLRDVEKTLPRFRSHPIHEWIKLDADIRFRFKLSGHILGSVFIELDCGGTLVVFSGDLGRSDPLTLHAPELIEDADYLFIESTYGDRKHVTEDAPAKLTQIITETVARGGQVLFPCFAVGRAQDLLFSLSQLSATHQIPGLPLYLDSPMAIKTTQVFHRFPEWHKLSPDQLEQMDRDVTLVKDPEASRGIQKRREPALIVAGSGMMTGGRILGHALQKLSRPENTFVLVGYQAAGTRGRSLRDHAKEIKMFGQYVPVHARVETLDGLSAHADQSEILKWLANFKRPPRKTYIVHGEPHSADALRERIQLELGWTCYAPEMGSIDRVG